MMGNTIRIIQHCCYLHCLNALFYHTNPCYPCWLFLFFLFFSGGKGIEEVCAFSSHHFIWHCSFLKKVQEKNKIGISYEGYGWEIKNVRADDDPVACEDGKLIPSSILLVLKLSLEKDSHETCSGPSTLRLPKDQISWRSEGLLDERNPHSELSKNCGTPPSLLPLHLLFFLPECLILYQFLVILQYLLLIMKNWNGNSHCCWIAEQRKRL